MHTIIKYNYSNSTNTNYRKSLLFIAPIPQSLVNFLYIHNLQHYLNRDIYTYNDDLALFLYDVMTLVPKLVYDPINGVTKNDIMEIISQHDIFTCENEFLYTNGQAQDEFIGIIYDLITHLLQVFSESNIINNEKVVLEITCDYIIFEVKVY